MGERGRSAAEDISNSAGLDVIGDGCEDVSNTIEGSCS